MHTKTLKQLSTLLHAKQISAAELATLFLDRIGHSDLNAFLHAVQADQTQHFTLQRSDTAAK